jgi:hypothetical protein
MGAKGSKEVALSARTVLSRRQQIPVVEPVSVAPAAVSSEGDEAVVSDAAVNARLAETLAEISTDINPKLIEKLSKINMIKTHVENVRGIAGIMKNHSDDCNLQTGGWRQHKPSGHDSTAQGR